MNSLIFLHFWISVVTFDVWLRRSCRVFFFFFGVLIFVFLRIAAWSKRRYSDIRLYLDLMFWFCLLEDRQEGESIDQEHPCHPPPPHPHIQLLHLPPKPK